MDEKEKIALKIRSMKKYVDFLRKYKSTSRKRLEDDYELKSAIERNFQLAIEAALDVGEIIISAKNFEKPEDYRSVILTLGRHNVIPPDFAERFARAAGFRNILVHMYDEVDIDKLYEYLQDNLPDFDEYAMHIARYLEG
ncbi:type VII toxin-antitoxin system HepT family RNase toxin [Methanocella conradii]|uniref:type VII toxin-antitoxin system HepT family RNase toxin n=1 Tax=Methanocella conradii TaxID=1175444 RepID=UPI00157E01D6|nr:DUF86 domain-containing protein [Methanocella conradii]